MFKPIKPFQENITGHKSEPQIRIGSVVPKNAVNLAYYYNPTATDAEKVLTADAPRNTIDHRVEDTYRYLFNQASKDDSLFPKSVLYEDQEGYIGTLGRVYVRWHEEAHVKIENIIKQESYLGLVNKEDVPKFISYQKDDFTGNLFLDAVDYTVSEYKTIGEARQVERQVLDHELTVFVEPKDLNTWMKSPLTSTDSPWPKILTVSEMNITNSPSRFTPTTALNPYDKYIGELVFDNIEYEEVRTSSTPNPEFTTEVGIITLISGTKLTEYVTAEQRAAAKTAFNALTKDTYKTSTIEPYSNSEIQSFLNEVTLKYCPTRAKMPAYNDIVANIATPDKISYLIQCVEITHHPVVVDGVTKYYFTKSFKVTKTVKGSDVQRVYAVYANYAGLLKKAINTEKQVPFRYSAIAVYKGITRKVWYDYDGTAYYRGSIIKAQSIGNMNSELSNEVIMYPDDNGKLFRLLPNGQKITKLEAEQIYLTNVFKDKVPCWYQYKLKHPIYDYRTCDVNGFYDGENVKVFSSNLKDIAGENKYQLKLQPLEYETVDGKQVVKSYNVFLYSSFLSKTTSTYKALYNTLLENKTTNESNGITEDILNYPFMIKGKDYYLSEVDPLTRENEIIVTHPMIINDTRKRVTFNYRILAVRKSDGKQFSSATRTASVLNREYILEIETSQFANRAMIISPKKDGIYMSPLDLVLEDQGNSPEAPVLSSNSKDFIFKAELIGLDNEYVGAINLYCNPYGDGVIAAETTIDTGFFNETTKRYTGKLSFNSPYYVEAMKIYAGYMVKCLDSRSIGVNQPREDGLLDSWYPMIRFGHYSQVLEQYGINKKIIYSMPEYDEQYFSPTYGKPYVDIKEEKAEILNNHMIKIKCTPMYIHDVNVTHNNVKVKRISGSEFIELTVKDVSFTDGVIFIKESISENDNIIVDYVYMEENYVYRGYWRDLDFCRIDLNPNQYHTYSDLNKVPSVTSPTTNLFNKTIYFYLKPSCLRSYEKWIETITKDITYDKYVEETKTWEEQEPIWSTRDVVTYEKTYVDAASEKLSDMYTEGHYGQTPVSTVDVTQEYSINGETITSITSTGGDTLYTKNLYQNIDFEFTIVPTINFTSSYQGVFFEICTVYDEINKTTDTIGLKISPNRPYGTFVTGNFSLFAINEGASGLPSIIGSDQTMENVFESTWESRWPIGMKIRIEKKDNIIKIYRSTENTLELMPDPVITYEIADTSFFRQFLNPSYFGIMTERKGISITMNPNTSKASTTVTKEIITKEDYISGYNTVTKSKTELVKKTFTDTITEQIEHESRDEQKNVSTLYHTIDKFEPESEMDLYIGSVFVRQNTSLESTVLIDTRTRGGGIEEFIKDDLRRQLEPESDFYLDIGYYDGKPYQENAVIVVRLDNSILKENGGKFTQSDIEEKVKKWLGLGVFPIIEYVDSYSKYDMPQYNLQVEDSYTNVLYEPITFSLDCIVV